jgi:DNA ligase 4
MPFKFRYLCDLLQSLDDNRIKKTASGAQAKYSDVPIIIHWFNQHDHNIPRHGTAAVAFLSCLFPERRADRVYNIQEKRLEKIVGRSLLLSSTRLTHLSSWRKQDGPEFAQTVQNIMREAEFDRPRAEHEVDLEEIDALFDRVAATYSGSSPELQSRILNPITADEALHPLLRRLQSVEAKWLIRMFLKRYTPIELPERLVMRQFHCVLPDLLCLQNSFIAAIQCLDQPAVSHLCPRPRDDGHEKAIKLEAAPHLRPQVGVMVQRSSYYKARSIQHCCDMAARRRISVERKYDGEYCQVHIDLSKGKKCIKIFSKSGKDSTADRVRLHGAIENALKLRRKDCTVKKQCILEGELLIWHEKEARILPFEKIRKHVTRNGRFLGNDQDSPGYLHERLMIMFYDLLLYDDIVCLNESLDQRRSRLRSLIHHLPGQAELGYREKINFASSEAKPLIRRAFAKCISKGWEGLVLKGCDDPYFSLAGSPQSIKLKRDYITGLGDVADLAIVGGRRDAKDEQALNMGKLSWTTFHLGSLENRDEVHRFAVRPRFQIVGEVSTAKKTLSPEGTRLLNERGKFERMPYASTRTEMEVVIEQILHPPTELFKNPFVVEVVGGGFEKPPSVKYYSLRFPRITKIHEDRSWHDIMSLVGLQKLANEAQSMAENEDSQEDRKWIEKLIRTSPKSKYVNENSASTCAGRDHDSGTNPSATPNARVYSSTPPLVRIDTQEMTEEERWNRSVLDGCKGSSMLSPSKATSSSKRKHSGQEQSLTATLSTKRLKRSPYHPCTDQKSALQGHISDLLSCRAQPRSTLLEIRNPPVGPRMTSTRQQRSHQVPSDGNEKNLSRDHAPVSRQKSTPAVAMLHHGKISTGPPSANVLGRMPAVAPLPTPPTSSSEESQTIISHVGPKERSRNTNAAQQTEVADRSSVIPTGRRPLSREEEQRKSALPFTMLLGSPCMIFLSSTMVTTLSGEWHEFLSNFVNVQASFTFSREVFLENMTRAPTNFHIVIVNIANHDDAGEEVAVFHQRLLKRFRNNRPVGEGCLIFFDGEVLRLLSSREDSIGKMKPHFGGCLAWNIGSGPSEKRSWKIKDIWHWAEVMDLVS